MSRISVCRCAVLLCSKGLLDELDYGHLASVATTGTHLEDTGVTAVAALVLGGDLVEELFYNGIVVTLGASLVLGLGFLIFLGKGNVVEVGHDLPAGMELAGAVHILFNLNDLLLVVEDFLLYGSAVLIFADGESLN